MMRFMSSKETSDKWGISDRRIRVLCETGRIEGAIKIGRNWSIPVDATKPLDAREVNRKNYLGLEYDFRNIDVMKEQIDRCRPFSRGLADSLREKLIVEWTYNSNAIEGNTLTLSETRVVLEGMTIGGKNIREHLEALNHREAIFFLEELIAGKESLNEWNIRNIHSIILKGIEGSNAGKYRSENVVISGAVHIPPKHYEVANLMQRLIAEFTDEWRKYHPIVRATLLHGEFLKIYPFIDGNGRTSRILMNFELMRNGYPPVIIKKEDRARYYDALDLAHTSMNYGSFQEMVAGLVEESERLWLSLLM